MILSALKKDFLIVLGFFLILKNQNVMDESFFSQFFRGEGVGEGGGWTQSMPNEYLKFRRLVLELRVKVTPKLS